MWAYYFLSPGWKAPSRGRETEQSAPFLHFLRHLADSESCFPPHLSSHRSPSTVGCKLGVGAPRQKLAWLTFPRPTWAWLPGASKRVALVLVSGWPTLSLQWAS